MQNFFSNLTPGGGGEDEGGLPWYLKWAGKGAGIISGGAAVFFGFWCCITITPLCIVAGIWQICAGLFIITLEAPFCCFFIDFIQQAVAKVDGRPVWQKALVYLVLAIPPISLCFGLSTLIGSGLIFLTAVIYGMMVLGPKGSKADMAAAASGGEAPPPGDQERIYDNEQMPAY